MKKTNFSKYAILGLAGMAALTALTINAQQPAQALVTGNITIGETMTAETVAPTQFGNSTAPTLGPVAAQMGPFGGVNLVPPGDSFQIFGPVFPVGGEIFLTGPAFTQFSIQTSVLTDFSDPFLSMTAVRTNPPAGAGAGGFDPGGLATIRIGGDVEMLPGVASGLNGGGGPATVAIDFTLP